MHRALTILLIALVAGCSAADPPLPQPGDTFRGSFSIAGRAVPLPPGDWVVLGTSARDGTALTTGAATALGNRQVVLANEQDGRLTGLVFASAGERGDWVTYSNWQSGACAGGPAVLTELVREGNERFQNCASVRSWSNPRQRPANVDAAWQAFFDKAAAQPGWAPSVFHSLWIRVAEQNGSMNVYYHLSPETRGFVRDDQPWSRNGWNPVNQQPTHKAYLARLVDWSKATHAQVRSGFRTGSAGPAAAF
jgi:hypothetical protein